MSQCAERRREIPIMTFCRARHIFSGGWRAAINICNTRALHRESVRTLSANRQAPFPPPMSLPTPPLFNPRQSPHSSRTSPTKRGNIHISADPAWLADSIQNASLSPPTMHNKPAGRQATTTAGRNGGGVGKRYDGTVVRRSRSQADPWNPLSRQKERDSDTHKKPGALTGSVSLIPARLG